MVEVIIVSLVIGFVCGSLTVYLFSKRRKS